MATKKQAVPKSQTAQLVQSLRTPLQLIAIPIVVTELVLVILTFNAQGVERIILIVGMLLILGAVLAAGYSLARQPTAAPAITAANQASEDKRTLRIEGEYLAGGNPNYPLSIRHLSDDVYEIRNPTWHGAGVVVGNEYHGVYVYGDNAYPANLRNTWGSHRATYDPKTKSFNVRLVQLSFTPPQWEDGKWLRASS